MWAINSLRPFKSPGLLFDAQHAYRRGRSTDTALHSLVFSIERSFRNKVYSLAAFLDIESAFNNVTPTAITGALTELGIERPIVGLIHTMLTRRVYSTMGSAHSTRNVSRGTPQGGVLSPLLWVNKLLSLLEEAGTKVVAYADDVVILLQGKFAQTLCNLMETVLSNLSRWTAVCHKIQRSAELCISGALRTTATEALNTILDLQPLDLLAKSWASATALRLREAAA